MSSTDPPDTHTEPPPDVRKGLAAAGRHLGALADLVKSFPKLEKDLERHAFVLGASVREARKTLDSTRSSLAVLSHVPEELDRAEGVAEQASSRVKDRLGLGIARAAEALGLPVSGRFPELKVGPLHVRLEPDAGRAELSMGAGGELLERVALEVDPIAAAMGKWHEELFVREFDVEIFRSHVFTAVERANLVSRRPPEAPVPISQLLVELNVVSQGPAFAADPSRRSFRPVGRAQVAARLFRARPLARDGRELRLVVATREQTRRKADHLYVPTDLRGGGAHFSSLQLRQGRALS